MSDSLEQVPTKDLRVAAALNAFNFVAAKPQRRWRWPRNERLARIAATHPPLRNRLDALNALEREQNSRYR